jgi:hypothetical protein
MSGLLVVVVVVVVVIQNGKTVGYCLPASLAAALRYTPD